VAAGRRLIMKYGGAKGYWCGMDDVLDHVIVNDDVRDHVTVQFRVRDYRVYISMQMKENKNKFPQK